MWPVVRNLWKDDALRYTVSHQAVVAGSDTASADSLRVSEDILESFPLGWEGEDPFGCDDAVLDWTAGEWMAHLIGWLFTTAAVSLGAPL